MELGWAQLPTLVWDKSCAEIGKVTTFATWINTNKENHVMQAKVTTWGALVALQAFRPQRLLEKLDIEGLHLPQEPDEEVVVSIEYIGNRTVVSFKTSTSTFVAEGLASHNSDLFDKTVDKGRMDLVKKDFLLGYAGGDTNATWRIKQVMKKELLKQPRLASFYVNVLHPAGRAFEKVEQHGVS